MPKAASKKSTESNSSSSPSTSQKTTAPAVKPLTKPKIKSFPCAPAFECKSGELLWGQLQHMIKGSSATSHDTSNGPITSGFGGGTILQSTFRYRLAARKGNWIVERFESESGSGFVVHHEDLSGQELLDRCAKIGISNGQTHDDHNIVYVNRYDWSYHSGDQDEVSREVKQFITPPKKSKKKSDSSDEEDDFSCDDNEFLDEIGQLFAGRLILLDAPEYQSYMKLVASGKHPENGDCVQFKSSTGTFCGAHLSDADTEYELGWMIFSGEKHKDFPQDDEFVGFVYDSSYCGLEEGPFTIV